VLKPSVFKFLLTIAAALILQSKAFAAPALTITGINATGSSGNGITSGALTYGQTGVVLYGFSITCTTASSTVSAIRLTSGTTVANYFTGLKLYSSTTNNYTTGTLTLVGSAAASNGQVDITSMNQAFTTTGSASTKYYFLVGDYTVQGATPGTIQFTYNTFTATNNPTVSTSTTTGNNFTLSPPVVTISSYTTGVYTGSSVLAGNTYDLFGFTLSYSAPTNMHALQIDISYPSGGENFTAGYVSSVSLIDASTGTTAAHISGVQNNGGAINIQFDGSAMSTTTNYLVRVTFVSSFTAHHPTAFGMCINSATSTNAASNVCQNASNCTISSYTSICGSTFYGAQLADWIGTSSDDWNNANNWSPAAVPGAHDVARIGVTYPFLFLPVVHTSPTTVNVGSIIFGDTYAGLFTTVGVTVNSGYILNVNGDITLQSDAQSYRNHPANLAGAGTIYAVNLNVFTSNTAATHAISQVVNSSVTTLTLSGNVVLTTDATSSSIAYNSTFNVTGGTVTVAGDLKSTNASANSVSSFNVTPTATATLKLQDPTALSSLSATGTNVVSFNNTGATVEYSGTAQTIYTDASITGLSGGVSYQNLSFSGSGIKTAMSGNLNVSGDFTNTLSNDASNYPDLSAPTVNFNGTIAQTLKGGSGNGTTFYNVTISGASTKTMSTGGFNVASTGVLTMSGSSTSTILNANGILTLKSDANGSAAVATIPTGPKITGNLNVQRFYQGGTTFDAVKNRFKERGYRIISSAVNTGTLVGGNSVYSLSYIAGPTAGLTASASSTTNAFVTGATGGNTSAGNPTLYLYRENRATTNASFTGGNFIGINNIGTSTIGTTDPVYTSISTLPVGNGVLFFFRGNATDWVHRTASPFVAPENVTLTATGNLNQGSIAVKDWYTPSSSSLGYTSTAGSTVTGFNMIGNPYASTIDVDKVSTGGITATNVDPTIYVLDPVTNQYLTFSTSTHTGTFNGKIASGQGFFVKALPSTPASPGPATFTFNESCKAATTQLTGGNLLMGAPVQQEVSKLLRLKIAADSLNYDEIVIGFKSSATAKFNGYEDAKDLGGMGAIEGITSFSTDSIPVPLAINFLPLPKQTQTIVRLGVTATVSRQFTLQRVALDALPKIYEVWLMDRYSKDSLDLRANNSYIFNVNLSDTASYGNNRFSIIIRQNKALDVHMLNFTATKATSGALVAWKTENEENYTNFTVQRSTDNGITYDVMGGFASNGQGAYNFTDKNPAKAVDLYRLKIEDLNGTISYSKAIPLTYGDAVTASSNISVYPNPAVGTINLAIKPDTRANLLSGVQSINKTQGLQQQTSNQSYAIKIVSINGSVVKSATSSQPTWQDDVGTLTPGTYIIQVVNNTDKSVVGKTTFVKK